MSELTLPGNIPGLLRRGSPVHVWTEGRGMFSGGVYGWHAGLVVDVHSDDDIEVWTEVGMDRLSPRPRGPQDPPCRITLDLTDATGRAHATWWLVSWWLRKPSPVALGAIWRQIGTPHWWTCAWPGSSLDAGPGAFRRSDLDVPALADLDTGDPRLLPDGSRWVDAEALRLVCLHVAGRAP